MNHYLPAVTLSSFLNFPKTVYSSKKQVPALISAEKDFTYKVEKELALAETVPAADGVPALGMRVVALTLTNNTHETIEVKKTRGNNLIRTHRLLVYFAEWPVPWPGIFPGSPAG